MPMSVPMYNNMTMSNYDCLYLILAMTVTVTVTVSVTVSMLCHG